MQWAAMNNEPVMGGPSIYRRPKLQKNGGLLDARLNEENAQMSRAIEEQHISFSSSYMIQ